MLTFILQAETIDPYKNIKFITLDNGLKVYLLSDKKAINTEVSLTVDVGRDSETKENAGITHLVEHLVFRDKRIPHRDYLDYIKEEGATYVNGYTKRYETEYVATIKSEKSQWLVQTFSQMIFNKEVDEKDLEIEKKALQIEIGELKWTDHLGRILKSMAKFYPEVEDIYFDEFGLKREKERFASYYYKNNNLKFTLNDVLNHYNDYYYPKNMTLKVAGNFELAKMKTLIDKTFGAVQKNGKKTTKEPEGKATLNHIPFINYDSNGNENYAYLGTKYILENYKKYLILDAYSEYLATKMQQLLRNELGQTYSVNNFHPYRQNAALVGISFEGVHEDFQQSIQLAHEQIQKNSIKMSKKEINEALNKYALYYSSLEHDSQTLLELLHTQEYLYKNDKNSSQTPYEIFQSITEDDFQQTISKNFINENEYRTINNDYYFFTFEKPVIIISIIILIILILKFFITTYYKRKGVKSYSKREILFSRRLRTKFLVLFEYIFLFIVAMFLSDWGEYILYSIFTGNPYYANTIPLPYSILAELGSLILYFLMIILVKILLFPKGYVHLDVTKDTLNLIGSSWISIKKEEILDIRIVPWSFDKFKDTKGLSLLFLKPLVEVSTKEKKIYLRTNNAVHLEEDLKSWKEKVQ
jgi:predicted Zn-dependent peptidase